jgi:hypothetical protein
MTRSSETIIDWHRFQMGSQWAGHLPYLLRIFAVAIHQAYHTCFGTHILHHHHVTLAHTLNTIANAVYHSYVGLLVEACHLHYYVVLVMTIG